MTAEEALRNKLSEGWFEENIDDMKEENETRWDYTIKAMEEYAILFAVEQLNNIKVDTNNDYDDTINEYISELENKLTNVT